MTVKNLDNDKMFIPVTNCLQPYHFWEKRGTFTFLSVTCQSDHNCENEPYDICFFLNDYSFFFKQDKSVTNIQTIEAKVKERNRMQHMNQTNTGYYSGFCKFLNFFSTLEIYT